MGRRSRQRTRSLVAILVLCLGSWMLPAQACAGLAAAAHPSGCPDCPAPCCQHDCCSSAATACAAAMPALAAARVPSPHHCALAPAGLPDPGFPPRAREVAAAERPPAYSPPSTLNIRFCSFQD